MTQELCLQPCHVGAQQLLFPSPSPAFTVIKHTVADHFLDGWQHEVGKPCRFKICKQWRLGEKAGCARHKLHTNQLPKNARNFNRVNNVRLSTFPLLPIVSFISKLHSQVNIHEQSMHRISSNRSTWKSQHIVLVQC